MRTRRFSSSFKRDYRKIRSGRFGKDLDSLLEPVVNLLLSDKPLPEIYSDHPLHGKWKGYRECHIAPDLLLVYMRSNPQELLLVRLQSHSNLF